MLRATKHEENGFPAFKLIILFRVRYRVSSNQLYLAIKFRTCIKESRS